MNVLQTPEDAGIGLQSGLCCQHAQTCKCVDAQKNTVSPYESLFATMLFNKRRPCMYIYVVVSSSMFLAHTTHNASKAKVFLPITSQSCKWTGPQIHCGAHGHAKPTPRQTPQDTKYCPAQRDCHRPARSRGRHIAKSHRISTHRQKISHYIVRTNPYKNLPHTFPIPHANVLLWARDTMENNTPIQEHAYFPQHAPRHAESAFVGTVQALLYPTIRLCGSLLLELAGAPNYTVTLIRIAAIAYNTHTTLAAAAFGWGLCRKQRFGAWHLSARAPVCIIRTGWTFVPVTK